jgi:hypothetical protein
VVDARDVIEGLVILGEQTQAAPLYPLARELIGTGAVALWEIFRFTQTIAGLSAAAAHQWEAAEDHLAMQQAESFPYCLEQADTPLPRNDADRSRRVDLGLEIRLPRS